MPQEYESASGVLAKYLHVRDQGGFEAVHFVVKAEGLKVKVIVLSKEGGGCVWGGTKSLRLDRRREAGVSDASIVSLHHLKHVH